MYKEIEVGKIKADGWIKAFLQTQANGLTGEIGNVGSPFSDKTWDYPEKKRKAEEAFLGGINSVDDGWVPYEQNGYHIDGAIRAGRVADIEKLIKVAGEKIYPSVEFALKNGYFGPEFLKDGLTWQYAIYFRALIAEYEATKDERIINAIKAHLLRKPIAEAFKLKDLRIITVRNAAIIETALWVYEKTKDERFLKMSEECYAEFNRRYEDSDKTEADENSKMRDVTVKGMSSDKKAKNNHGVTYCEICKLAAIMYYHTGKEEYKSAAINAFDKVYRDNMLVDGVISSTEYLNGNEDSQAMHETCDVSDFSWAVGYLYKITGDPKYGDWVENCIYNGGLGAVDDEFKGEQYFSCPNQAICDDTSNHAAFYRGEDWNSYAPKKFLACCAGNVHRFMPNAVCRAFMQDGEKVSAFIYMPCRLKTEINGKEIEIEEKTAYPFDNEIKFTVKAKRSTKFTLVLRKPEWAINVKATINGKETDAKFKNGIWEITREYADGDEVTVRFYDEVKFIENAKGISVKKGCLLYALPIKERVEINGYRELGNKDFPHYSLYPESKWNYGLSKNADVKAYGDITGSRLWTKEGNGLKISVEAKEIKTFKLQNKTSYMRRLSPRGKYERVKKKVTFTPKVGKVKTQDVGKAERIELVPYCTTRLRIAIFPMIP